MSVPVVVDRTPVGCRGWWARNSAVECLLCKEEALGSNPSGSIPMHRPVKARTGRAKHSVRQRV